MDFGVENVREHNHLEISRLNTSVGLVYIAIFLSLPLIGKSVCNTWRILLSNIKDVIQPSKTAN